MPNFVIVKCKQIAQQERFLCPSFVLFFSDHSDKNLTCFRTYLSQNSMEIQAQTYAPIQCKIWPRNVSSTNFSCFCAYYSSYFCMSAELVSHRRLIWFFVCFSPKVLVYSKSFCWIDKASNTAVVACYWRDRSPESNFSNWCHEHFACHDNC